MKKKLLLSTLAVVMVVAIMATCLVACNPDKDEAPAKASNAETLGTAIAMAASTSAGGATAAGENDLDAADEEGININVSGSMNAVVSGLVSSTISAVTPALEVALQGTVNSVQDFVAENNVKVESLAKDAEGFVADSDYTLKVSVTHLDKNEQPVTDVAYVAIDTNGADIEGTAAFDYSIDVYVDGVEDAIFTVSGSATYKSEIEGLAFGFKANIAGLVSADISAYATKEGTIAVDVNAGANALGIAGATAGVKVELGKLADNKYGANVAVNASASVMGNTINATVNVDIVAEKAEDVHAFNINGSIEIKVDSPMASDTIIVKAALTGDATYNTTDDEFVVSVSGDAAVTTEAKQAA